MTAYLVDTKLSSSWHGWHHPQNNKCKKAVYINFHDAVVWTSVIIYGPKIILFSNIQTTLSNKRKRRGLTNTFQNLNDTDNCGNKQTIQWKLAMNLSHTTSIGLKSPIKLSMPWKTWKRDIKEGIKIPFKKQSTCKNVD